MTVFFPDIASYEAGMPLAGLQAIACKATEGTTYINPDYARVAVEARQRGILLVAYHFLRHGSDPAAQARHFHDLAGDTPAMLDVETAADGSRATVADALAFTAALKALGGRPRLIYLPRWYWQQLGSPDLTPLTRAGLGLVSSNYAAYSDSGPGWAGYGGATPVVWQYTDAHDLAGFSVDMNAYRGSLEQLRALIEGGDVALKDDPDGLWLFPRVEAIAQMRPPAEGPEKGQDLPVLKWMRKVEQDAATAAAGVQVALSAEQLDTLAQKVAALLPPVLASPAAVATAVVDEQARRLGNG